MTSSPGRDRIGHSSNPLTPRPRRTVELSVLVLADLKPGCDSLGPIPIDSRTLKTVLSDLMPELHLRVEDVLGAGDEEMCATLRFQHMKSFRPDGIVDQIPMLADLVRARQVLDAFATGQSSAQHIREELPRALRESDLGHRVMQVLSGAPPPSASAGVEVPPPGPVAEKRGGSKIDELLARVDIPVGKDSSIPHRATSIVESLAGAISSHDMGQGIDRAAVKDLITEIDRRLTSQLSIISDHPELRRLESAWLSMKFLVDRISPRDPIRIEVLPADKERFLEFFFDRVFEREYEGICDTPLDLVVTDFEFDRSPPILEKLQHMARMGQSLQVPVLGAVSPEHWGLKHTDLVARLPDLLQRTETPEYALWNQFRGDPASVWVSLAVNRMLLRNKWGTDSSPVKSFKWLEEAETGKNQPLWGSPAIGLATVVTQAFAVAGLSFPIAGPRPPALLENMELQIPRESRSGQEQPMSVESHFSESKILELARSGFAPLVGLPGKDRAFFAAAPTLFSPSKTGDPKAQSRDFSTTTLPFRIFAGMAARSLKHAVRTLAAGAGEEALQREIGAAMISFLASSEEYPTLEEVDVRVEPREDAPEAFDVEVHLKPHFRIYGEEVDLTVSTTTLR